MNATMEGPLNCRACGTENRNDRKFCRACGTSLAPPCPHCGAENDPGDNFCGNCGGALNDATTPGPAAELTGPTEKRFVSVLFADLVDYTSYSERRDSEDVREMLTVYYERAREIIERFGGTVEKFIGDAVVGVWGAVAVREDDAERAVRAALELVDMVAALGVELDHPELVLRAAVNSGSTSVGPGTEMHGLVVGDLVNTAARLQSIADPGTVFVGSSTETVTSRAIQYESMGSRPVKGKEEPVDAWKALRVEGLVGGRSDTELRLPPFVGREREMRLLKDQLLAAETEERARLVSIVGEAGIGKTRLAEEFKNHIDGYTADVYWHQGRSPSYGDGVAFWALGEMVRRRAGIVEGEDPARARTRLRTCLTEFVGTEEDRRWIEPRLEGLLGLADMPPGARSELFAALRSFFQHIAFRGTTVLVFEDLHWADGGLLDFISELVERSTRSPILIITLARPDLLDRFPTWGAQHRNSMAVRLSPLTDDHMRQMLSEYLPGIGEEVTHHIVDRSAGFPLYAVEIVRMLTSSGKLTEIAGKYRFDGDTDTLALPESLQAVIGARLDRLDPDLRTLLQDGSILGQKFSLPAVLALRPDPETELERELAQLVHLEILEIEDDPRSPGRGQYRFVQSLFHEVAYQRLNRRDRRDKHLQAAAYFESFNEPELAGLVAAHYMGAYSASPEGPERDGLAVRAMKSLTDAAARAAALGSHLQAMDLLDQAIELSANEDQRAELRLQAAGYADAQSEVERGIAYVEAARDHFTATDNVEGRWRAATAHSAILNSHYRSDDALEVIRPVYDSLESVDDAVTVGVAAEAARSFMLNFDRRAIEAVGRLLPAAAGLDLHEIILQSLVTQGTSLAQVSRLTEAKAVLRGAAIVAEDMGLLHIAGRAYNNLGAITYVDNPREAGDYADRVGEIAERLGDFGWIVRSAGDRAGTAIGMGRYAEALELLNQFEEDQLPDFWKVSNEATRAHVELLRTGSREAGDAVLAALSFFDGEADPQLRTGIDQQKAGVYALLGDWDRAFEMAMAIDPAVSGAGVYEAAQMAAWTRSVDRIDRVAERADEVPFTGRLADGTKLYIRATQKALKGDLGAAADLFDELLELFTTIAFDVSVNMVRVTYSMLVGEDHPGAARAGQLAHEWLVETGSHGLMRLWADGLPADAGSQATG